MALTFDDLDKDKIYCKHCFTQGIKTHLTLNKETDLVEKCKIHNNMRGNFHILVYKQKYNTFVDVRGCNPNKIPEIERPKATSPVLCSICNTYNESRDQNGRGRDLGYGKGVWEYFGNEVNLTNNKNETITIKNGDKCGCECSKKWYTNHNQTPNMRAKSKNSMLELNKRNDVFCICPACGGKRRWYLEICSKCGYNSHEGMYHCQNCGEVINSVASICPKCGYQPDFNCKCRNCGAHIKNVFSVCSKCDYHFGGTEGSRKRYELKNCSICNNETPHDINTGECLVCKTKYVWCERCQKWESIKYNSKPNHWLFWSSETKKWITDNPELVLFLEDQIIGFKNLLEKHCNPCIYGWFINDETVYIGESKDIILRSYNHMMNIVEYPEYWYNVIDYLNSNTLEVKILEEIDGLTLKNLKEPKKLKRYLKDREKYWINKCQPDSQKCDGTDRIKPINERKFKIIT